jgi:Fur family zinc uptake transcriptional regulator
VYSLLWTTSVANAFSAFPAAGHDHRRCVSAVLAEAEQLCQARNQRLTSGRRRVLEIIAGQHSAIGAYEIIDRLCEAGRRPAPITVYRALDFLIKLGLVHRVASINAYVVCPDPVAQHGAQFLICGQCGTIGELRSDEVSRTLVRAAQEAGFAVSTPFVEARGLCRNCDQSAPRLGAAGTDDAV